MSGLIVVLSVFGDDSQDETKQRVFAVAGVMASEEEWDKIKVAWIARTGGKPFHATDCDSDRGDYVHIKHKENKTLYKDLVQILVKSEACGIGTAIDIAGFKAAYPDVPHEMSYYKAFFETVRLLAVHAKKRYKEGVKFNNRCKTLIGYRCIS